MKKLLTCFICAVIAAACVSCTPKADEKTQASVTEDDFEISVSVPKYEIKVGETLTVTAEFKNISDKKIMINNSGSELSIGVFKSSEEYSFYSNAVWSGGYIKPGRTFKKRYDFTPKTPGEYYAIANGSAGVILKGDINSSDGADSINNINVYSEKAEITVTE